MSEIFEFFRLILSSEEIIKLGLTVIVLIVFAETGLFFCFFLPGDYLLFLAGMFCSAKILDVSISLLTGSICLAAILGNYTAYIFGRSVGSRLFHKKDSLFFKKKYLDNTKDFFAKYGGKALIIARFLPIIRTFAPILAGTAEMQIGAFSFYNIVGGIIWSFSLVLGGYYLADTFPNLINYVEYIILGFIGFTTFTVIRSYFKMRNDHRAKELAKNESIEEIKIDR